MLKGKNNSWVITVPLALVVGGYMYFAFLPNKNAAASLRGELAQKRAFVSDANKHRASVEAAEESFETAQQCSAAWREATPTQATLPTLYGDINVEAKEAQVEITEFSPGPPTLSETFRRVPLDISLRGTLPALFDFLRRTEEMPPTIWVENMKIEATGEEAQTVRCELKLVIFADNPEKSD